MVALDVPLLGRYLIEASAGSGKTWTLTAIILRLLLDGVSPDKIVATTFTNDAAFEIKTRVFERISTHLSYLERDDFADFARTLDDFGLKFDPNGAGNAEPIALDTLPKDTQSALLNAMMKSVGDEFVARLLTECALMGQWGQMRARLRRAVLGLDGIYIGTIDGLLGQWLLAYGDELGIVSAEPSTDISELLTTLTHDATRWVLAEFSQKIDALDVGGDYQALLYDALKDPTPSILALQNFWSLPIEMEFCWDSLTISIHHIAHAAQNIKRIDPPTGVFKENNALGKAIAGNRFWQAFDKAVNAGVDLSDDDEKFLNQITHHQDYVKKNQSGKIDDSIVDYAKALLSIVDIQKSVGAFFVQQVHARVKDALSGALLARGQSTFWGRLDDFLTRLDGAMIKKLAFFHSHVLIDEAQDLNHAQAALLKKVFWHAKLLVLVGDPKQAIYRFRGSDVANYLDLKNQICEDNQSNDSKDKLWSLESNYRSQAGLIDALNAWFDGKNLGNDNERVPYAKARYGGAHQGLHTPIYLLPSDDVFKAVAIDISHRLTDHSPNQIAVLVRSNAQIDKMARALGELGIKWQSFGKSDVTKSAIFSAMIWLLIAIHSPVPKNVHNLMASALFYGQSTKISWWIGVLTKSAQMAQKSISRAILWTLEHAPTGNVWLQLSKDQLADLSACLDLIAAFFGDLPALIDYLKNLNGYEISNSGDDNAIMLMTVHKSKGLEFDVVYAMGFDSVHSGQEIITVSDGRILLRAPTKEELVGERRRLLYVALTRAAKTLIIPTKPRLTSAMALHEWLGELSAKAKTDTAPAIGLPAHLSEHIHVLVPHELPMVVNDIQDEPDLSPSKQAWEQVKGKRFFGERRTSFSALMRGGDFKHADGIAEHLVDEFAVKNPAGRTVLGASGALILFDDETKTLAQSYPRGANVGTFLHKALETLMHTPDGDIAPIMRRHQLEQDARPWLDAIMHTPLVAQKSLHQIQQSGDFLTELGFNMSAACVPDLQDLFYQYLGIGAPTTGGKYRFLRGEIDLVYRCDGRYYVVDYKSNALNDYSTPSMIGAMDAAGYWLQALIYQTALHRFLKLRLNDYDAGKHLGAVEYVFLRGGRLAWQIDPAMVLAFDESLRQNHVTISKDDSKDKG